MSELRHGTRSAYVNHRCRCDDCRAANAAWAADRARRRAAGDMVDKRRIGRAGRTSPVAAARLIEALLADGMTVTALAGAAALSGSTIDNIRSGRVKTISCETERRIEEVWEAVYA